MVTLNEFKSIQPPSNVICVQNVSRVPTIFAHIFVPTLMSAHSSVQYAGKLLRANMIESAMKGFILERKSSFAKENSSKAASGVVVAASHVLMH